MELKLLPALYSLTISALSAWVIRGVPCFSGPSWRMMLFDVQTTRWIEHMSLPLSTANWHRWPEISLAHL